jgi:hypothetical protein
MRLLRRACAAPRRWPEAGVVATIDGRKEIFAFC